MPEFKSIANTQLIFREVYGCELDEPYFDNLKWGEPEGISDICFRWIADGWEPASCNLEMWKEIHEHLIECIKDWFIENIQSSECEPIDSFHTMYGLCYTSVSYKELFFGIIKHNTLTNEWQITRVSSDRSVVDRAMKELKVFNYIRTNSRLSTGLGKNERIASFVNTNNVVCTLWEVGHQYTIEVMDATTDDYSYICSFSSKEAAINAYRHILQMMRNLLISLPPTDDDCTIGEVSDEDS